MTSLLRTEWLKIKYFRPFWVLLGLYPVCLGGSLGIALWSQHRLQTLATSAKSSAMVEGNLPFGFPHVWQSVSYLASWFVFIPALLLILNVTNEFTFRTHRQNLIEGWSRARFFLSKLLIAVGISLFCTANVLLGVVVSGIASGTSPTSSGAGYVGAFLLQTLVYQVFALLLAFTMRRAAIALGAFLMYATILESMLKFFIDRSTSGYGAYLPLKVANALLPIPFLREKAPQAAKILLAVPEMPVLLGLTAGYLVAACAFIALRFRSEDL